MCGAVEKNTPSDSANASCVSESTREMSRVCGEGIIGEDGGDGGGDDGDGMEHGSKDFVHASYALEHFDRQIFSSLQYFLHTTSAELQSSLH
jgi:hypothetical protein